MPDQTVPDQTEPDQTEPDQTEPDQTEPDQTEPDQTEPAPAVTAPSVTVPVTLTGDAVVPAYALPGDAGADLVTTQDVELAPHQRALVGTGVSVAIPEGYAAFVHPRSGLAHRLGLSLVNAPGTVDSGYRGEIEVNLVNTDPGTTIRLRRGDRIAQLVVQPVVRAVFTPVSELPPSERGVAGHGSTGAGGSVPRRHRTAQTTEGQA